MDTPFEAPLPAPAAPRAKPAPRGASLPLPATLIAAPPAAPAVPGPRAPRRPPIARRRRTVLFVLDRAAIALTLACAMVLFAPSYGADAGATATPAVLAWQR